MQVLTSWLARFACHSEGRRITPTSGGHRYHSRHHQDVHRLGLPGGTQPLLHKGRPYVAKTLCKYTEYSTDQLGTSADAWTGSGIGERCPSARGPRRRGCYPPNQRPSVPAPQGAPSALDLAPLGEDTSPGTSQIPSETKYSGCVPPRIKSTNNYYG